MKHNYFLTAIIAFTFFVTGCKNQEDVNPQISNLKSDFGISPTLRGDVLAFNSTQDLSEFLDNAKKEPLEKLSEFIRQIEDNSSFKSLMPTFLENEEDKALDFIKFKVEDYNRLRRINNNPLLMTAANLSLDEVEIDLTEDEIIADPYFASILNSGRQVIVANDIYAYNQYGVGYTSEENREELETLMLDDSFCSNILGKQGRLELQDEIYFDVIEPIDDCSYSDSPTYIDQGNDLTNSTTQDFHMFSKNQAIIDQLDICTDDFSVWDVFGPAKSCNDYFSTGQHRIKTKTWNQNYLVYASVGLKVKGQKKKWGVWMAHDVSELELGYSSASFEYSIPNYSILPKFPQWALYEFDNTLVDPYGNLVPPTTKVNFKELFQTFPFPDPKKNLIKIYLNQSLRTLLTNISNSKFSNTDAIDISAKEVNNELKKLAESAFKQLTKRFNKEINGPVVIAYPNTDFSKVHFIYLNWYDNQTNENKIQETFSWNFEVTLKLNLQSGAVTPKPTSKSYDNFKILCYGIGRKDSEWRGKKILLVD